MPKKITTLNQLYQTAIEDAFAIEDGFSAEAVEHFYTFLQEANLLDQGRILIDPDVFYWLEPLYHLKRSDILGVKDEEGNWIHKPKYDAGIVMRKASQMGASTWSVAFIIWLCIDRDRPLSVGCYWPTKEELQVFIATRLDPMLETCEKLQPYLKDADFNNTQAKNIGRSIIYFRHVAGRSGMDSQPMDVVVCDEVRLWNDPAGALQRIDERMGQSDIRLRVYMSTVGSPEDFMEQRWFESNQLKYFSYCPSGCGTEVPSDPRAQGRILATHNQSQAQGLLIPGVVLSEYEPNKIISTSGHKKANYVCPGCGSVIEDPSDGSYQETRPQAIGMLGLEFARTLSKRVTPWEVLTAFRTATDMKQFMNGWMAKPFLNPEGRPVTGEHWNAARQRGIQAGLFWQGWGTGAYLGADFRTNEMHIVIGELGQFEVGGLIYPGVIRHIEVYQGAEWEERLDYLMRQFGVQQAVIDYMPNSTGTLKYAKRHEGKVLLAEYRDGEVIRLGRDQSKNSRKVSPDGRELHKVSFDQVKSMMTSLTSFAEGQWLIPEGALYQQNYVDRKKNVHPSFDVVEGMEGMGREGFRQHLMCLALENVHKEGKNLSGEAITISGVITRQNLYDAGGFDPHWAHAFNYMVMGSRISGGGAILLKSDPDKLAAAMQAGTFNSGAGVSAINGRVNLAALGPQGAYGVRQAQRMCGGCKHGPLEGRGICQWTGMEVGATEPACNLLPGYRARS